MGDDRQETKSWYATHWKALHAALIVVVGCGAYCGTFAVPFLFDDYQCIVGNHVVQHFGAILELGRYREFGISEDIRNNLVTRFVTYLTFAGNFRLHGLWVGGYHAVNLLIHLGNGLLVYALVRITVTLPSAATAKLAASPHNRPNLTPLALVTALVFVSHPIETNGVTYIVQRFASLATFFCLVSLVAYADAESASAEGRRRRSHMISLLAALFAMYTKEISFTFPAVIALYDITFLEGDARTRIRRLAPLFMTMLFLPLTVAYLASLSVVTGGRIEQSLNLVNFADFSRWHYFITQLRVIVTYLRLLIFPVELNFDYDYPLYTSLLEPQVLGSALLVAALLAFGLFLFAHSRRSTSTPDRLLMKIAAFGIFWFFITLAMEASIIPLEDLIFEYRLYLPSIGFFTAGSAGGAAVWRRVAGSTPRRDRYLAGFVFLLVVSLAVATFSRNRVWGDETAFWEDVVRKSPDKARPRWNLAESYGKRGLVDETIRQYLIAKTLSANGQSQYELGLVYCTLGRYDEAIAEFREALHFRPDMVLIHNAIGRTLLQMGMLDDAEAAFRTALFCDPDDREARSQLGFIDSQRSSPRRMVPPGGG
ncbi:MAG TPA: tetratricopeptide repeat protein [Geobacteraceae bacterium]